MDFSFRHYKTGPLITCILLLSIILDYVFQVVMQFSDDIFRGPSNATLIGILFYVYNKWLWKMPILNLLVTVPDISGRYSGIVEFTGQQIPNKECKIEIFQTASTIKIRLYTLGSKSSSTNSTSLSGEFLDRDGHLSVNFIYYNFGSDDKKLDAHEGVNILNIHGTKKKWRLEGKYFTNRQPQTRGHIEATFESVKTKGKF